MSVHDNSSLLVKVVSYPSWSQPEVEKLLKLEVKKHSCHETNSSNHFPLVLPNNPKTQLSTNVIPNEILFSYSFLKQKQEQPLTKESNKFQLIKRLTNIKIFFC